MAILKGVVYVKKNMIWLIIVLHLYLFDVPTNHTLRTVDLQQKGQCPSQHGCPKSQHNTQRSKCGCYKEGHSVQWTTTQGYSEGKD